VTVLRDDPPPGEEAQIDYGYLGSWTDPAAGSRRRRVWAFVMVLATSRLMFNKGVQYDTPYLHCYGNDKPPCSLPGARS